MKRGMRVGKRFEAEERFVNIRLFKIIGFIVLVLVLVFIGIAVFQVRDLKEEGLESRGLFSSLARIFGFEYGSILYWDSYGNPVYDTGVYIDTGEIATYGSDYYGKNYGEECDLCKEYLLTGESECGMCLECKRDPNSDNSDNPNNPDNPDKTKGICVYKNPGSVESASKPGNHPNCEKPKMCDGGGSCSECVSPFDCAFNDRSTIEGHIIWSIGNPELIPLKPSLQVMIPKCECNFDNNGNCYGGKCSKTEKVAADLEELKSYMSSTFISRQGALYFCTKDLSKDLAEACSKDEPSS